MSTSWKCLRGEELSVFAVSGEAQNLWGDFAAHLHEHGTKHDFFNFVEAHPFPVNKCLGLVLLCDSWAMEWVRKTLPDSSHYDQHHVVRCVARTLAREDLPPWFRTEMTDLLNYIDYKKFPLSERQDLLTTLIEGRFFDHIQNHWSDFSTTVQHNLKDNVVLAAQHGFDLRLHVSWVPQTADVRLYFESCCEGGLWQRAQECNVRPTDHKTIVSGFSRALQAGKRNPQRFELAEQLWGAYPKTRWHKDPNLITSVLACPPSLAEKMIVHYEKHSMKLLRSHVRAIVLEAVCTNRVIFERLLVHLSAEDAFYVAGEIIEKHSKVYLKDFLKLTDGQSHLMRYVNYLQRCSKFGGDYERNFVWVSRVLESWQNTQLRKAVKSIGKDKTQSPKRKM